MFCNYFNHYRAASKVTWTPSDNCMNINFTWTPSLSGMNTSLTWRPVDNINVRHGDLMVNYQPSLDSLMYSAEVKEHILREEMERKTFLMERQVEQLLETYRHTERRRERRAVIRVRSLDELRMVGGPVTPRSRSRRGGRWYQLPEEERRRGTLELTEDIRTQHKVDREHYRRDGRTVHIVQVYGVRLWVLQYYTVLQCSICQCAIW